MKIVYLLLTLTFLNPIVPKNAYSQSNDFENYETYVLFLQLSESANDNIKFYNNMVRTRGIKQSEYERVLLSLESSFGTFKLGLKVIDLWITSQRRSSSELDYPFETNLSKTIESIEIYWNSTLKRFSFKVNNKTWSGGSRSTDLNRFFKLSVKGEI